MRTRILPKMLNSEVEEYLQHNDIIIVPVGTVERLSTGQRDRHQRGIRPADGRGL